MPWGFYYDPTYILVLIGVIICMIASARVRSAYNKYNKIRSKRGITGAEAAEKVLHSSGIYDVAIERVSGQLTDHYDPRNKVLSLSDSVYNSDSVAAVGVAAHECGHAIQHAEGYGPLSFRSAIVPIANIGSTLAWPIFFIGILISSFNIITIGIVLFCGAVLFQLVTLPVEFNASSRALMRLESSHILYEDEMRGAKKVLSAAALTYVASLLASILQLLRLIVLAGGRRRD